MNIPEALTIASKTLELTKSLRDIDHRIELAELKNRAADIYQSMADLKMALVDAHEEIQNKDKEIQRLLKEFSFKGETIERHNMIYEKRDDGPVGFPFCPRCLTVDGRHIKLAPQQKEGKPAQCPQCKSNFERQTEYIAKSERPTLSR
jgi:hypothetical protein